ncbi:hypothetical protein C8F04DRAFT_1399694 [Mycena alexandri]|uniref:Uncharacterized protein n=1 Tax=Mycena alexandri TaxID=1745969 RepID=A0AAD6SFL5_9AGAR|nr:hypothetical protein C8F04DRAFT_1399694 [Mycena alexandri]
MPAVVMPLAANSRRANPAHPASLARCPQPAPPAALFRHAPRSRRAAPIPIPLSLPPVATLARRFCGPFPAASALRPRRQPLSPLRHPVLRSPHLASHTRPIHAGPSPAPFTPRTKAYVEGKADLHPPRGPFHPLRALQPQSSRVWRVSRRVCRLFVSSPLRVLGRESPLTTFPCVPFLSSHHTRFPFLPGPRPTGRVRHQGGRVRERAAASAVSLMYYSQAMKAASRSSPTAPPSHGGVRAQLGQRVPGSTPLATRTGRHTEKLTQRHHLGRGHVAACNDRAEAPRAGEAYGSYSAFGSAVLKGSGT